MDDEKALSVFEFGNNGVRSFLDERGEPWFVAADVCKALGYANAAQAINDNVESEDKAYTVLGVPGRYTPISASYTPNAILIINEAGLYSLILSSRKPEAKRFKKWVTSEVLPALRQTGTYSIATAPGKNASVAERLDWLQQSIDIARAQQAQINQHEERIERIEAKQTAYDNSVNYFTVIGYQVYRKLPACDVKQAQSIGREAAALSNRLGYTIGVTADSRYGRVNTYHIDILDRLMDRFKGAAGAGL